MIRETAELEARNYVRWLEAELGIEALNAWVADPDYLESEPDFMKGYLLGLADSAGVSVHTIRHYLDHRCSEEKE